jgi:hypothetical protein
MNSFKFFVIWDYIILIGVILIALIILLFNLKKIKRNFTTNKNITKNTRNIPEIFLGLSFIILSFILYYFIEKSHTGIFKAVSMLTSRPFVIFSIVVFLIGIILIICGLYKMILYYNKNKKLRTSA